MTSAAIRTEGLGKQYRIGPRRAQYKTLRDALVDVFMSPVRRARMLLRERTASTAERYETIWALKDVSLEITHGEVVGIIGRNGAGKSTLLKILSRITEPTVGFAEIQGRVGSLLEVGTGFHGELTGRENVYLNGAILGMKRAEIDRKFDEIVSFAEVEKFIDTPVKHYSSGMYLRLAFAVAAHLEPEILIVDEVLAVGDVRFQKKCLNKMQEVGRQGRTVLFVSHNMPAITRLCERVILLDGGALLRDGPAAHVVSEYLNFGLGTVAAREWKGPGRDVAGLLAVRVRAEDGRITDTVDIRATVRIEMEYDVWTPNHLLLPYFSFSNEEGVTAFSTYDTDPTWRRRPRPCGRYVSTVSIPGDFLTEGTMFVGAGLTTIDPEKRQFFVRDVVGFHVIDTLDGDSVRGDYAGSIPGVVRPRFAWSTDSRVDRKASVTGEGST